MKKIIAFILLAALWGMASLCAAAKPKYLPASDSYIHNVGNVQVRSVVSPAYISEFLGAVIDIRQGEKVIGYNQDGDSVHLWDDPAIVYFEGGTVWLDDPSGETDMDTEAMITRAVFTKKDVFTQRGIHIGDNVALVNKKYGQPSAMKQNRMKAYQSIVDVWQQYITEPYVKLYFGIRNGRVAAIAVSVMPANGL